MNGFAYSLFTELSRGDGGKIDTAISTSWRLGCTPAVGHVFDTLRAAATINQPEERMCAVISRHVHKNDLATRLRSPAESELRMRNDLAWLKEAMRILLDDRGLPHPEDKKA